MLRSIAKQVSPLKTGGIRLFATRCPYSYKTEQGACIPNFDSEKLLCPISEIKGVYGNSGVFFFNWVIDMIW